MPIYEYRCKQCGNVFERIQKFSDPKVESCPECSGDVEQVLTAPAVQFKGSGWYVTDYARRSGGNSGKKDAGTSSEGDSAGKATEKEKKTESKPESKKESK